MTKYEDEQREELAYTSACVSTAFKRYRRTRRMKNAALAIVAGTAAVVPGLSDWVPWLSKFVELARSNIVAWYVATFEDYANSPRDDARSATRHCRRQHRRTR
jgi:hypothetical protein